MAWLPTSTPARTPVIRWTCGPNRFLTPDRSLILCSSHGALFTRDEGLCIAGPCPGQSLRRVPVEVVGEYVMLADGVDPLAHRRVNAPRCRALY